MVTAELGMASLLLAVAVVSAIFLLLNRRFLKVRT